MFIVNEAQKMKNVSFMFIVNETHQFYVHSK